ncbi:MAG: hypothetical protein ACRDO7_08450, partial [Nocardioidaceae bacterium]
YSDEDGTEAASLDGGHDADEIADRVDRVSRLVEELTDQRAADRHGETVSVLVERIDDDGVIGRAEHQGPEVDGCTVLRGAAADVRTGAIVTANVRANDGVDLTADVIGQ